MNVAHKENYSLCLVFPMGIEAYPFLKRVETRQRSKIGKAIYRECFFEGHRLLVVRSGIGPDRAARSIRSIDCHVSAFISVGTSGALTSDLSLGQMIIVNETVNARDPGDVLASDGILVDRLAGACARIGQEHIVRRLATNNQAVFSREDREALNKKTLAGAVDMESHSIALEARKRGSVFAGLRVISDTLNSGPLPEKADFRSLITNPVNLRHKLSSFMKWRHFIKQFFFAINRLDPVLISFLRTI